MATLFNTSWIQPHHLIDGDKFEALNNLNKKILYLKTDTALTQLNNKEPLCPSDYTLITHNSDFPITQTVIYNAENVGLPRHWYAQNALVKHPKITALPIGLERTRWFPHMHKRDLLLKNMNQLSIKPDKLCLANFSLSTNLKERKACLEACRTFSTISTSSSVLQDLYRLFLEEILNHYFVLCPEGNGIDTHRLWETLYLGRIPVITFNPAMESFKDLPILIIPSWKCLTQKVLLIYLENFQSGKIPFSLEKLKFQYWEEKIGKNNNDNS